MRDRSYNLADLFEVIADAFPERLALVAGDDRRTYAELDERASRLAHHLLERGVRPGDWVGIYSWNRVEWVEAMIGCFKARAVPININYRYVEAELAYLFDNADLRGLIFERSFTPFVTAVTPGLPVLDVFVVLDDGTESSDPPDDPRVVPYEAALAAADPGRDFPVRSSDDLYVLYTGGTTGMPKGVLWRGEDIFHAAMRVGRRPPPLDAPDDLALHVTEHASTTLLVAPLMHGAAQWGLWSRLTTGDAVAVWTGKSFDADAILRVAASERATSIALVGDAMARPLSDARAATPSAHDLSGLRTIISGGALLSQRVREQLEANFAGVRIVDTFGASETGYNGTGLGQGARFSVGATTSVLDAHLVPVEPGSGTTGMLARRGHIPLGYHKDPEKTAATFPVDAHGERWVMPGDLATVESDGTIVVFGRGSQVINTGGEKVFPEEVESALKSSPDVFDAMVVGVPDDRFGERVAALVTWRDGSTGDVDALREHTRTLVAGYKVPRAIHPLAELVRTPAGKPDYRWAKARAIELTS